MKAGKAQRRKAAETQSEELNFAPSRLVNSALNAPAPAPAPKGRKAIAQGNAPGSVPEHTPSPERAEEGELLEGWHFVAFIETIREEKARVVKVQQSSYQKSGRFPKEACERVLAATRQLKQSLLHHLLTARLRVPLDKGGRRSATPL